MHPPDDLLQFKDYSNSPSTSPPPAQISVNSPERSSRVRGDPLSDLIYDMTNAATGSGNTGNMNTGAGGAPGGGVGGEDSAAGNKVSFLTIEYYQQFFNVDTVMVMERIANSIIPKRAGVDYLRHVITPNPDLYGPFWITVTLIFSIAITGNIASYLHYARDDYHWHYNFRLVSYAATCIFLYANCFPAMLWGLFKYSLKPIEDDLETQSAGYTPSLLSLMCVYGYSLSIYIPVSILWVIPISLLQWILVISAALVSGMVLIIVLTPALRNSKFSLFLMIGILSAHFLLAAGFMLYFFHGPDTPEGASAALKDNPAVPPVQATVQTALNLVKHAVAGDIVLPANATA